jgi:small subunit ribosomal protein S1
VSEDFKEEEDIKEDSFADLFEAYSKGMNEDLQVGDSLKGKIISIGRESIFIDTGTKTDGVVDINELLDDNQELSYKVGDTLELYVVFYDGNEIRLSKSFSGAGSLRIMDEAFQKGVPVEGKIKEECKGGFHVSVMGKRAFCPISHIDLKYVENTDAYLGETFSFLITQFDEDGRNIVVSRRKLLEKELEKRREEFFGGIAVGMQVEGRVTRLMPYGAFVELLPGIEGMVHISEMSWSRAESPEDIIKPGEIVTVKIVGIEQGKQPGETKLSLSMKQITGDPWDTVEKTFAIGDRVGGKVTRCAKFGAFVEIAPGIEGLVHISEMSHMRRIAKAEDIVTPGDTVGVVVKEIDAGKRRISLSMKDTEGDPWADIHGKYNVGQSVDGTVEKKERFGYFVSLEPGITGLLPRSSIEGFHKPQEIEKLGQGDAIRVIVDRIDQAERKIALSLGSGADDGDWKDYAKDSGKSMGSLGEKLRQALESKSK